MCPSQSVIIGIGGAGLATIACMQELGCNSADTIAVDVDPESLYHARAARKMLLNRVWASSAFMGSSPVAKRSAIERDLARIREATHRDLVILVGGLGGITGTRLIPLFAREAHEQGALVIAMPIMPFHSEKEMTLLRAHRGLANLEASADTVMPFLNQTLINLRDGRPLVTRFRLLDSFILQILQGLVGLVNNWGRINLDLADVRAVLSKQPARAGFIGICEISDLTVIPQKVLQMFLNPLRVINPKLVDSAVISLAGSKTLNLHEVDAIVGAITNEIAESATIKFGIMVDPRLEDSIRVTVLGSWYIPNKAKAAGISADQHSLLPTN